MTPDSRLGEQMLPFSVLASAQPPVKILKSGCMAQSRMTILHCQHRRLSNHDGNRSNLTPSIARSCPCRFRYPPSKKPQIQRVYILARCSPNDLLPKPWWTASQDWPMASQVKWGAWLSFSMAASSQHQCHHLLAWILVHGPQSTRDSLLRPLHLMFPIPMRLSCQVATYSTLFSLSSLK